MTKRPMGRPRLEPDERRRVIVSIRLTPAEHAEAERAAKQRGVTLSDLARTGLLAECVPDDEGTEVPR